MKAVGFCKHAAHAVVVKFFIKFFTARESNDRQTGEWMNAMKFRVSLLAKHCRYQTLDKCINAAVVILLIKKYSVSFYYLNEALIFSVVKFFEEFFRRKRME